MSAVLKQFKLEPVVPAKNASSNAPNLGISPANAPALEIAPASSVAEAPAADSGVAQPTQTAPAPAGRKYESEASPAGSALRVQTVAPAAVFRHAS